jgi:hypothetical protein
MSNNSNDKKAGEIAVAALCAGSLFYWGAPEVTVKSNPVGDYWAEHALHVPPDMYDPDTRAKGIVYSRLYTITSTSTASAVVTPYYPSST